MGLPLGIGQNRVQKMPYQLSPLFVDSALGPVLMSVSCESNMQEGKDAYRDILPGELSLCLRLGHIVAPLAVKFVARGSVHNLQKESEECTMSTNR